VLAGPATVAHLPDERAPPPAFFGLAFDALLFGDQPRSFIRGKPAAALALRDSVDAVVGTRDRLATRQKLPIEQRSRVDPIEPTAPLNFCIPFFRVHFHLCILPRLRAG
jgi:hypothetical protein